MQTQRLLHLGTEKLIESQASTFLPLSKTLRLLQGNFPWNSVQWDVAIKDLLYWALLQTNTLMFGATKACFLFAFR